MITVVRISIYILLAPLFAGLMAGVEASISARLQGGTPPHILQGYRNLMALYREPWTENDKKQRLWSILYAALIIAGGSILFAGGNLGLSVLLLLFAESAKIFRLRIPEEGLEEGSEAAPEEGSEQKTETPGGKTDTAALSAYACQLLLTAAGFYCFTASYANRGSFSAADLASSGTVPALYLPVMLIGFIWLLIQSRDMGFPVKKEKGALSGKDQAFSITGNWYRVIALYAVLFLFNYGGTVLSAVLSAGICLVVWFLSLLLQKPHSRQPESVQIAIVSVILQIASFVNLFVLLP